MKFLPVVAGIVLLVEGVAAFVKELPSISNGLPSDMTYSSLLIATVCAAGLLLLGHGLAPSGSGGTHLPAQP